MTQPSSRLTWVQAPKPARTRTTQARLEDAARGLLAAGAWQRSSVEDICRRASCTLSAFRSRYAGKDALMGSVCERFMADATATAEAVLSTDRWDGCSIPAIIRETVTFTVVLYREQEPLIRAMMVRQGLDEDFRSRGLELGRQIGEQLRKLILARRKELLHPAPAVAAEFSARLIHGILQVRALNGDRGEAGSIKLTDEQVTTELIHAVLAYLGVFTTDTWDS